MLYSDLNTINNISATTTLFKHAPYLLLVFRDVGFSGDTAAIIHHALRLLADDVVVTEVQKFIMEIHIQPRLVLPHLLNLTFYSNQVNNSFLFIIDTLHSSANQVNSGVSYQPRRDHPSYKA